MTAILVHPATVKLKRLCVNVMIKPGVVRHQANHGALPKCNEPSQHATTMPFVAPHRTIDALATHTPKTPKRQGLRCCALCNKRIYQRSDVWCTSTQRSDVWFARTPRLAILSTPYPGQYMTTVPPQNLMKRPDGRQ